MGLLAGQQRDRPGSAVRKLARIVELVDEGNGYLSIYVTTEEMRLQASVRNAVYSLKLAKVEHEIWLVQEDIKKTKDEATITDLLAEQTILNEARKVFSAELSRVVLK